MEAGRHKVKFQIRGNKHKRIHGTLSMDEMPPELQEFFNDDHHKQLSNQTSDLGTDGEINVVLRSPNMTSHTGFPNDHHNREPDPKGASTYVIAVILIYGVSIIFLIASHVFIKKKEFGQNSEKQILHYLEQAPSLKMESEKESFKVLKTSLIPMIARSPSGRALMAKRLKYTSFLQMYSPSGDVISSEQQQIEPQAEETPLTALPRQTSLPVQQTLDTRISPPMTYRYGDSLFRYEDCGYTLRHTDSESEYTDDSSDILDHETRMEDVLEADELSGRETMV